MITVNYYFSPKHQTTIIDKLEFNTLTEYNTFLDGETRRLVAGASYAKVSAPTYPNIDGTEFNFA